MAKKARLKSAALSVVVPADRDHCATLIRRIGDLQRDHARERAALNDRIAALTEDAQPVLDSLAEQMQALQQGVQTWCETHRDDLTNGGKVKTANLITGEVQWRQRPPSVRITGAEAVIATLERLGLGRYLRIKKEVNKEAILNEPSGVDGVGGISISKGKEDFVITPYEIAETL
ncbi:MAG: host-nuclease inhibitor Gam family protein [Gammaproteobacteria bacterium SHHR-1]